MADKSSSFWHSFRLYFLSISFYTVTASGIVPAEQLLYRHLMNNYSSDTRPVINDSQVVNINFTLKLHRIIDLDERRQCLETNVFINQAWVDENLKWNPADYSGIKMLRVPAKKVWLPDTFVFNNANDGFSGFMQGVYVLLKSNGSVHWPVPVKMKTTCRVVITYFPFDDQVCVIRLGSWIYNNQWVNYKSSQDSIDMTEYIHNSEWDLVLFQFEKVPFSLSMHAHSQSDLTFKVHLRRQTFFYIFNIIVPCIMLSILTLLTFWLPPTSAEKISLGLSVFLAFSMFMLLIAEEVPATSESIPLIGIYLTTVMTLTSVSVVMAVMVINLYNRGSKAKRPPSLLRYVVLNWLSKVVMLRHNIEKLARTLNLEKEEELKYRCSKHENIPAEENQSNGVVLPLLNENQVTQNGNDYAKSSHRHNHVDSAKEYPQLGKYTKMKEDPKVSPIQFPKMAFDLQVSKLSTGTCSHCLDSMFRKEDVWVPRNSICNKENDDSVCKPRFIRSRLPLAKKPSPPSQDIVENRSNSNNKSTVCKKLMALRDRKRAVVEWQTIAAVVDRLLFWIFVICTITAYVVILIYFPYTKPKI